MKYRTYYIIDSDFSCLGGYHVNSALKARLKDNKFKVLEVFRYKDGEKTLPLEELNFIGDKGEENLSKEELLEENKKLKLKLKLEKSFCEVCWTNSWVPVPKDFPGALKLKDSEEYVVCDMCRCTESLLKYDKALKAWGDKL